MSRTLPLRSAGLVLAKHPDVGADAGVVKKLLRQRDQGFEVIVLQDPAADLAFAGAGVAGEERRAVHDDADAAGPLVRVVHPAEHVLEEQELAVADPRQTGLESILGRPCGLGPDCLLIEVPVLAIRRIGEEVVERAVGVAVMGQSAAEGDVVGVAAIGALDVQVGLADRERLRVDFLAEQVDVGVAG